MSYRGVENDYGNIYKSIYGINIWGDSTLGGGEPYICKDYNFAESKNTDNYEGAGFTVANSNGYISALGYSSKYDWLFLTAETKGNSANPIGDYTYTASDLSGFRVAFLGGGWSDGLLTGLLCWRLHGGVGNHARSIGGRLLYVPQKIQL